MHGDQDVSLSRLSTNGRKHDAALPTTNARFPLPFTSDTDEEEMPICTDDLGNPLRLKPGYAQTRDE